jgi:hypothetical protein
MKISSLALTAVVLLAGTTTHAFAPRRITTISITSTGSSSSSSSSSANIINSNDNAVLTSSANSKNTALFTATSSSSTTTTTASEVGAELGLKYCPIAPFGKGAPNINLGNEAKHVLGGKGANLAEMSELGLSVPPGFTITTECCNKFCNDVTWDNSLPKPLWDLIIKSLEAVQDDMSSKFGSPENPLLLSVRSGAAVSMPGMVRAVHRTYLCIYSVCCIYYIIPSTSCGKIFFLQNSKMPSLYFFYLSLF